MSKNAGEDARRAVYHDVVSWVAEKTRRKPEDIDVSKKFSDPPYRITKGGFDRMCKDICSSLSTSTGREISLPKDWVIQHRQDQIGVFITNVAIELLAAPMNSLGRASLRWVIG